MRLIKLGLSSVNTTVGAVKSNVGKAIRLAEQMAKESVTVGVFQEQLVGGYPCEDLVQWPTFIEDQWAELERFAAKTKGFPTLFALGVAIRQEGRLFNCAAMVAGGRIVGLVPKQKLPTYDIFYEGRNFARGHPLQDERHRGVPFGDFLFQLDFGVVGVEVCEDLWSAEGPLRSRAYSGAELALNLSASPYRLGIWDTRRELLATRSTDHQCALAYANAVGANDGLIFDGGGFVFQNGRPVLAAPRFVEGFSCAVVDLDRTSRIRSENSTWRQDRQAFSEAGRTVPRIEVTPAVLSTDRSKLAYPVPSHQSFFLPAPEATRPSIKEQFCEELLDALSLGVGDYFEKTKAFRQIGVALSGGRDSLLTLLIAHRYAKKVRPDAPGTLLKAFYMPSRFSSAETRQAAEAICAELSVVLEVVSIEEAFERELAVARQMNGAELDPVTLQNIQARVRAQRMWNWANASGGLYLQTGNMSEKAAGYTTIGGDLMGSLAVIANVPKTVVIYLLNHLLEKTGSEAIALCLARPAGPELRPNQLGEEELMPFPILDACFYLFAEEKLSPPDLVVALRAMFPDVPEERLSGYIEKFTRLFLQSIHKWVQAPLSLHLGRLDLDRERAMQLPVVHRAEWLRPKG